MGHTKFAPDKLFSGIAKTFCKSDVFCVEMLDQIIQQYATSHLFTSRLMLHWKAPLKSKYLSIPGITDVHDIVISKKSGNIVVSFRKLCFNGEYTVSRTTNIVLSKLFLSHLTI